MSGFSNSGLGVSRAEVRCTAHQMSRMRIKAGQSFRRGFETDRQSAMERLRAISAALARARRRMKPRAGIERAFR